MSILSSFSVFVLLTFRTNLVDGKVFTKVAVGNAEDVDLAVEAAREAYKKSWGLKVSGYERGRMLNKLADLVEANIDELSAIEALDCGIVSEHVCMPEAHALTHTLYCKANNFTTPSSSIFLGRSVSFAISQAGQTRTMDRQSRCASSAFLSDLLSDLAFN